eukprot:1154339-Pelagomonas_calceolata.AAC.2
MQGRRPMPRKTSSSQCERSLLHLVGLNSSLTLGAGLSASAPYGVQAKGWKVICAELSSSTQAALSVVCAGYSRDSASVTYSVGAVVEAQGSSGKHLKDGSTQSVQMMDRLESASKELIKAEGELCTALDLLAGPHRDVPMESILLIRLQDRVESASKELIKAEGELRAAVDVAAMRAAGACHACGGHEGSNMPDVLCPWRGLNCGCAVGFQLMHGHKCYNALFARMPDVRSHALCPWRGLNCGCAAGWVHRPGPSCAWPHHGECVAEE